jgi:hypothetical protein
MFHKSSAKRDRDGLSQVITFTYRTCSGLFKGDMQRLLRYAQKYPEYQTKSTHCYLDPLKATVPIKIGSFMKLFSCLRTRNREEFFFFTAAGRPRNHFHSNDLLRPEV